MYYPPRMNKKLGKKENGRFDLNLRKCVINRSEFASEIWTVNAVTRLGNVLEEAGGSCCTAQLAG